MPHTSIDNNLNFNILFRKDLEGFIKVSQERLQGGKLCWNHLSFHDSVNLNIQYKGINGQILDGILL